MTEIPRLLLISELKKKWYEIKIHLMLTVTFTNSQ